MIKTSPIQRVTSFLKKHQSLLLVLLIAALLRIPYLNGSFWLDEAAQALESIRPLSQQFDIVPDFQPPLLHLIVHFASYFSYSEWWLRLWGAVIPGLITIAATYKIGERLFSKNTGVISSILLATSSFHIFFSQELRPYSLPAMWATLSILLLVNLLTKTKKQNQIKSLKIFTIINLLGLFSSYLYPFFLIAQFLFLLISFLYDKKNYIFSFSQLLKSAVVTILLFLPWMPMFLKQLEAGQLLRTQMPNWETVVSISQLKTMPLVFGKFFFGIIDLEFNVLFISLTLFIFSLLTILLINFHKTTKYKDKKHLAFLFSTFLITIISAWIVSFWIPVIRPKRLLMLMPILYLIISSVSLRQNTKLLKYIGITLLTISFIANIYSTKELLTKPIYQREDWRSLHSEISKKFPMDDTVTVFSYPAEFSPWAWYDKRNYKVLPTGYYYISDNPDIVSTLKPITDYNYVLVFDYLRDLTDPNDQLIQEIEAFGYKGIGVIDRPNIGFVRIYTKEEIIIQRELRNERG